MMMMKVYLRLVCSSRGSKKKMMVVGVGVIEVVVLAEARSFARLCFGEGGCLLCVCVGVWHVVRAQACMYVTRVLKLPTAGLLTNSVECSEKIIMAVERLRRSFGPFFR